MNSYVIHCTCITNGTQFGHLQLTVLISYNTNKGVIYTTIEQKHKSKPLTYGGLIQ